MILNSSKDSSADSKGVGGCVEVSGLFGGPESFQAIDNSRLTTLVFNFLNQDAC